MTEKGLYAVPKVCPVSHGCVRWRYFSQQTMLNMERNPKTWLAWHASHGNWGRRRPAIWILNGSNGIRVQVYTKRSYDKGMNKLGISFPKPMNQRNKQCITAAICKFNNTANSFFSNICLSNQVTWQWKYHRCMNHSYNAVANAAAASILMRWSRTARTLIYQS